MGDKVYKPIIKDKDHLIRSKNNPNRVRGLTRDENNKNPDIIEWEEYDVDDLKSYCYVPYPYEERSSPLTPEQEKLAQQIGEELGAVIADGIIVLFRELVVPWCKESALPWIKEKGRNIKNGINEKKKQKEQKKQLDNISTQIDKLFDPLISEINEEEAQVHMMKLIYHMLGLANEIRIISNMRIQKECQSDELCIERQKEVEMFLSEKVAISLNQLLSNENIKLNFITSRKIFSLTGGGIRKKGEYLPVQAMKIDSTLKKLSKY
ncbi:MAG: hypothetical protein K2N71_03100 [Oscillospiraceae bacterium]|nr:hypothetical protein [Oscillospiraceae bacterium]